MHSVVDNKLQKCNLDQLQTLQTLAIQTYQETFEDSNSEALLQQYYKESLNLNTLSKQLVNDNSEFYFIYSTANDQGKTKLAGYLKLNIDDAQTDLYESNALEVEKIYILKQFLGQGLGKKMITFAIERAKHHGKQHLWLGVWENNFSARNFYSKMGFIAFGEHNFNMGGELQKDLLYRKDL